MKIEFYPKDAETPCLRSMHENQKRWTGVFGGCGIEVKGKITVNFSEYGILSIMQINRMGVILLRGVPFLEITVLLENESRRKELASAHGLSVWVREGDMRLLFDTGPDDSLLGNAKAMGYRSI